MSRHSSEQSVFTLEAEDHRSARDRRTWLTVKAGLASKASQMLVRFLSVPLTISILGNEKYGLWLAVGSIVSWFGLSNFGVTSGLLNLLAGASAKDDKRYMKRLVSSSLALFLMLAALVAITVLVMNRSDYLERVLGLQTNSPLRWDSHQAFVISGLFFALTLALSPIQSACSALQEGYLITYGLTAANLLSLGFLYVLKLSGEHSLKSFALTQTAPTVCATAALGVYYLGFHQRYLRPAVRDVKRSAFADLGSPSILICASQVSDIVIHYSTNIIIAHGLGPGQVPRYAVPYSLFMFIQSVLYGTLQPLWAAYAEANVRNDWHWILKRFLKSIYLCVGLTSATGIGLILLGPAIIKLWAGRQAVPSRNLLTALAAYFAIWIAGAAVDVLVCGLGYFQLRLVVNTIAGIIFLVGSLLLTPRIGLLAAPVAGMASGAFSIAVFATRIRRRSVSEHNAQIDSLVC
jgi:O-antigen/teichoic acid export membrane protein